MASCGISLNLSSLESKISAHISAAAGVAGLAGLPMTGATLTAVLKVARGDFLGAIKIMVPSDALDGLWEGLREDFDKMFDLSDKPGSWSDSLFGDADADGTGFWSTLKRTANEWGTDLSKFAKSTGLDQLSGFVDIDVTDLAKSAIGLGASFDSCDFGTSGIQNFYKDPATGTMKLLANYAPKLGDTSVAKGNSVWGLTAEINSIFQSGKAKTQLSLNVALGDVLSSGTSYALDKITGSTPIDSRDISNIKQYLNDYVSPTYYQSMRTASDGSRFLATATTQINDLQSKIAGVYATSENSLNVMSSSSFGS